MNAISVRSDSQQQEFQGDEGLHSSAPSPLSAVASKSTFYHTLANVRHLLLRRVSCDADVRLQPRSVDSLVSEKSEQEVHYTEEEHEIQVERIAGRQSLPKTMGALLPRRLARHQSQLDYVSIKRGMVIDVSVETTTEPSRLSSDLHTSTAYATRPSRARAATVDILSSNSLMERAKDLARKLRRKSHRI